MRSIGILLKRFFTFAWKLFTIFRSIVVNFLFLLILLFLISALADTPRVQVPEGAALVIAPAGVIVEQASYIDPFSGLIDSPLVSESSEVLLKDILDAIEIAQNDPDISALVLQPGSIQGAGFSKLQDIGAAIINFKSTGKRVYASADSFSQGQYYLASYADEISVNPLGGVDLEGFSSYQLYYKDALDKLNINFHIFRVGEYKSAVEPYERNDMSDEARAANIAWLEDLWQLFIDDVSLQRNLESNIINQQINNIDTQLAIYDGDAAQLALQTGLVDYIRDRTALREYLMAEIGSNNQAKDFKQINFENYLSVKRTATLDASDPANKIGIIVAKGTILDGSQRQGNIGGDSLSTLIRQARENDSIKAVVLRIDSGGGSAFASEVIRSELLKLKESGKPIVASMGSTAASGGYWIASPADEIWASPSTITGSIGIFAIYPTFEGTFKSLGVYADGVGTTELAGAFAVGRELPEFASNAIQLTLQNGYDRFLTIVAEARGMSLEEVDAIAQGRVWSGQAALEIGLVDNLGNLDQAISSAASLAQLDDYEEEYIEMKLTTSEQLLKDIIENISFDFMIKEKPVSNASNYSLSSLYQLIQSELNQLIKLNDPNGMYTQCLECRLF